MKQWQREAIRIAVGISITLACWWLAACQSGQMVAPSGVGVSSGIGRTQTSVTSASRYNDVAAVHNANAMTRVQRIEAKAAVVAKYWGK